MFHLPGGALTAVRAGARSAEAPFSDGHADGRVGVCPLRLFAWYTAPAESAAGRDPVSVYPVNVRDGHIVVGVSA